MSVGLRKNRLLLRGNVWPKLMAASVVERGLKQHGAVQSTTLSSLMLVGVTAHGVV